jgi:hypothetical protein
MQKAVEHSMERRPEGYGILTNIMLFGLIPGADRSIHCPDSHIWAETEADNQSF